MPYTGAAEQHHGEGHDMRGASGRRFAGIALAGLFGAASQAGAEQFSGTMTVAGEERSYTVVAPEGVGRSRLPAVFALHGAFMDGRGMQRVFALDAIAQREGFLTVYPNGANRRWNDGRRFPWRRAGQGPDDVAFLANLARRLVEDGLADPRRLYLAGVSNGGMMVYRMACEAPQTFAAYTAIIANMPARMAERCRPGKGAPMLIMNATHDPLVPWKGGRVGPWGDRNDVISTKESLNFWRRNNGCEGSRQTKPLPDKDRTDGSTVIAEQYNACRSGAPVVLLTIEGGGHLLPGTDLGRLPLLAAILGKANRDISAADIGWKFFRRFPATP